MKVWILGIYNDYSELDQCIDNVFLSKEKALDYIRKDPRYDARDDLVECEVEE